VFPIDNALDIYHHTGMALPFGSILYPDNPYIVYYRQRAVGKLFSGAQIFYGAGTVLSEAGVYGPAILLRHDRLIGGETRFIIKEPSVGDGVALHDQPSETLMASGYADSDGATRTVYYYGVPKPRGNSSAELSADDPVNWGGISPPWTYPNIVGEVMNSYWLKPLGLYNPDVDIDGYIVDANNNRVEVTILTGYATWLPVPIPVTSLDGVDVAHSPGGTHIASRSGDDVIVYNTYDRGYSWTPVTVASLAPDATPTIMWDPEEDWLYVWFHTDDGVIGYKSQDVGATWQLTSISFGEGGTYPRTCWAPEGYYLVVWVGGDLQVWRTSFDNDNGFDLEITIPDVPEQLAELTRDRWGRVHVLWTTSDDTIYRRTRDGTWGSAVPVLSGGQVVSAHGGPVSLVAIYNDNTLEVHPAEADAMTMAGSLVSLPSVGDDVQYIGLSFDSFGIVWLVVKLTSGTNFIRYSEDRGVTWQDL
jgi:hypothetical protein